MRIFISLLLLLGLITVVTPVSANALTFYLDEVNDNNTGTLGPWATVTLTDSTFDGKDSVHFVVAPIESFFSSLGPNFGLQTFYFNGNTAIDDTLLISNFAPAAWSFDYGSHNAGGDFGKFEFLVEGTGSTRANPLSFDIYASTGTNISIADFASTPSTKGYLFASHIADYNSEKSAKFATNDLPSPVPEPSTILLLGGGLLGLGWYGRKRKKV